MISISLVGDRQLIARMASLPASVHASILAKVYELTLRLEARVKTQKLNGQVLNRKTGRLARSIGSKVEDNVTSVLGVVFQSADVPYGAIHEFGGKIPAHVIRPKKASVLRFFSKSGDKVFARSVNHPGAIMPERSYLRSSLRDMSTEISLGLKEAVFRAVTSS